MTERLKHDPRYQLVKREKISFSQAMAIRAIALVLSLIVCAIVIVMITKMNFLQR